MTGFLDKGLLVLQSPAKRVRAEVAVETVWIGTTVYPECPVWRVWYDGRPVVDISTAGLTTETGPLAYGMRWVKSTRHRPQTGIGPGREIRARFADRGGRELELMLRVTDLSACCAVRQPRKRKQASVDLSVTRFPKGSVLLENKGMPNARPEEPQVRFVPSGKLVAFWRHGLEQHLVFFDRPGDAHRNVARRRWAARLRASVPDGAFHQGPFASADFRRCRDARVPRGVRDDFGPWRDKR